MQRKFPGVTGVNNDISYEAQNKFELNPKIIQGFGDEVVGNVSEKVSNTFVQVGNAPIQVGNAPIQVNNASVQAGVKCSANEIMQNCIAYSTIIKPTTLFIEYADHVRLMQDTLKIKQDQHDVETKRLKEEAFTQSQKMTAEIQQERKKLIDLQKDVEAHSQKIENQAKQLSETNEWLTASKNEAETRRRVHEQEMKGIAELKASLEQDREQNAMLKTSLEKDRTELAKLRAILEQESKDVVELKATLKQKRKDVVELRAKLEQDHNFAVQTVEELAQRMAPYRSLKRAKNE